jgi:Flp pilus assembly protein TadD
MTDFSSETMPLSALALEQLHEHSRVHAARDDALAVVASARAALRLDQHEDALALAQSAVVMEPGVASSWQVLASALERCHHTHLARVAWERAVALDGEDLAVLLQCARAQVADGAPAPAKALLSFVLMRIRHEQESIRAQACEMWAALS